MCHLFESLATPDWDMFCPDNSAHIETRLLDILQDNTDLHEHIEILPSQVFGAIKSLVSKKASGPDGLTTEHINGPI